MLRHPLIAKFIQQDSGGYNAQRTTMDLPISLAVDRCSPGVVRPTDRPDADARRQSAAVDHQSRSLDQPTITVPIANYDNNQHAENENIRIQNLWDGIEIFASLMTMKF